MLRAVTTTAAATKPTSCCSSSTNTLYRLRRRNSFLTTKGYIQYSSQRHVGLALLSTKSSIPVNTVTAFQDTYYHPVSDNFINNLRVSKRQQQKDLQHQHQQKRTQSPIARFVGIDQRSHLYSASYSLLNGKNTNLNYMIPPLSNNMKLLSRSLTSSLTSSMPRIRRSTTLPTTGIGSGLTPFLFVLTTAFILSLRPTPICYAEKNPNTWSRLFSSSSSTSSNNNGDDNNNNEKDKNSRNSENKGTNSNHNDCPYFGCIMRPIDVHYSADPEIVNAFEKLRSEKRTKLVTSDAIQLLSNRLIATSEAVTLTLIGYKGGTMQDQINQDRSIIVSPYVILQDNNNKENNESTQEATETSDNDSEVGDPKKFLLSNRILLGVFDGHAPLGELVSEYTATTLPKLLAEKLYDKSQQTTISTAKKQISVKDEILLTSKALEETFVELDRTAPADVSGGCTATVVLQQGQYVYIANAGDSRSFIITYRPSTNVSTVIAISREDKPSLPDERQRVEKMGGQVYIPIRGTSRVVYHDPTTGAPTGLAMSRSIGDWEAGKLGVIPNPLIQVFNINDIVTEQIAHDTKNKIPTAPTSSQATIEATGHVDTSTTTSTQLEGGDSSNTGVDDVYIFAVCATDGMMDYINATEIARVLGHSLYAEEGAHPVAATEHLIFNAASLWHHSKQGRYRDDIAIAVATLRKPPSSTSNTNDNDSDRIRSKL